ncbi:hypothetical protein M2132_000577 [Dysgonomonas sp. PH5-45]|uniref:porin family protein n=1 Tax=unclassified Dysgonomonas TaxID=2630389 RepID=UPI00247379FA|nr:MULTISPECIES: porin family protein [unclassified Dysgonomonas]MDH6354250.1 hypothetical protein [Dysgonomonas sp. PH5-45]MDH6387151.1 hypothetical protein [Dysgonomonas sp. PH5-37]
MKTIYKISLMAIVLLSSISVARAQENTLAYGIEAGANLSTFGGDDANDLDARLGWRAALHLDYNISNNFYTQIGINFLSKGANGKYSKIITRNDLEQAGFSVDQYSDLISGNKNGRFEINTNMIYFQMPIHAGYRLKLGEGVNAGVFAGPYFAYGVGGKTTTKLTTKQATIPGYPTQDQTIESKIDTFDDNNYKDFDMGISAGVNGEYNSFVLSLGYEYGLTNISDKKDINLKNRNAYCKIGYKF